MATKKKAPTKKAAAKGGRTGGKSKSTAKKTPGKGTGSQPKFGSAAWFAKYPKAKRVAKKSTKKKK